MRVGVVRCGKGVGKAGQWVRVRLGCGMGMGFGVELGIGEQSVEGLMDGIRVA